MENRFVLAIVVMFFVAMFAVGFFVGDEKIDVAGCTAEWKTTAITVQSSELCSANQCTAQPADQQHNAIVGAVLCACGRAKAAGYADAAVNSRIEEVVSLSFSYQATAQELCEQPGIILVRHAYG
jgi:hypothetical protein